jgi:hypothetical protein
LKTSTTFNQLKFGYVKQITDPLDARISALELVEVKAPIIEEIIADTDGQTVFTLKTATYSVGKGEIEIEVNGVPQSSGEGFTETSSSSITLSEGVLTGTVVRVIVSQISTSLSNKLASYDLQFANLNPAMLKMIIGLTSVTPYSGFTATSATHLLIAASNTDKNNFPEQVGGVLVTYRLNEDGYTWQEFHPLITGNVYKRAIQADLTWGAWKRIGGSLNLTTAERNAMSVIGLSIGDNIYDTTLNKPIWVKTISPLAFVDATGAAV